MRWALRALLAVSVLLTGCAYVPLEPLGGERHTGNLEADEQHLWKQSRKLQHEIETSGLVYEDPELDAYLTQVLARVTPEELGEAGVTPRVQVIENPDMHAYSFANGVVYIHTGLLARLEDETQLATILSRELAHVAHRHALRAHRDKRAHADTLAWVGVGTSLMEDGDKVKLLAQAVSITSLAGFHHVLETQADDKGLALLHEAGYDVQRTPDFFQMTVDYQEELHTQGPWAWVAFAPPPHMTSRIAGYRSLIAQQYAGASASRAPVAGRDEFRRRLHEVTRTQAELELASGLFESAEKTARLATASEPSDPNAWVVLGLALQGQRDKPRAGAKVPSIREVRGAYARALEADPGHPTATRELGMTYYRKTAPERTPEATEEALRHLRRYLTMAPDAGDAQYVRRYVHELEAERR